MALIKCTECGENISDKAKNCPKCGAPVKKKIGVLGYVAALVVFLVAFSMVMNSTNKTDPHPATSSGATTPANTASGCSTGDIAIKSMKAGFVDKCSTSECYVFQGVAVITNNCSEPIGVQVKITGLDNAGAPVSSRDLWPASVRNIPPGDYTISLDTYLNYDARIKRFEMSVIDTRKWR